MHGTGRIPSDDFGVQMQTYRVPGSDAGAREGHACLCSAFFTGCLRGLGWKRLLLRSDNERALLAFLRAAAAGLEGVEVIEQASPETDHEANELADVGVREVKSQTGVLKSHLEEKLKRQLDWSEPLGTWWVRHSANCLVEVKNSSRWEDAESALHRKTLEKSSCRVWRESSIPTGRGTARRTRGRRCGENDAWHFRC